ncbi:MAG: LppP/LprE family lipoprotein [Chloroflexi bacterium]|nr:LppP/LprE family lipoprotein [Chloroflexota bacterium]
MRTLASSVLASLALILALLPGAAAAQSSWLDQPLSNWNQAGMDVPQAPAMDPSTNPQCLPQKRPIDTSADQALSDAGWTLFSSYAAGWDTYVVRGLSGYDGMCRPLGYNVFVFVNGQFAGTISPSTMDSRTDGTGDVRFFGARDSITAEFQRYAATDPLCCPSGTDTVSYQINRTPGGPVLVPQSVSTQ